MEEEEIPVSKVLIDAFIVVFGFLTIVYCRSKYEPYRRGIICNDVKLLHPFVESTVSTFAVYNGPFICNCLVILVTEYFQKDYDERQIYIRKKRIPILLFNVYRMIGIFVFGAICDVLVNDTIKYTVGRYRPYFLTACKPDVCAGRATNPVYYMNFTCTEPKYQDVKTVRLSFPSAHSSFGFYCAVFIAKRMTWKGSGILKPTLQFLPILGATYVSASRIADFKHHYSDVFVGIYIGTTIAFLIARYCSALFMTLEEQEENCLVMKCNVNINKS